MKEIKTETLYAAKKAAPNAAGYAKIPGGFLAFETKEERDEYRKINARKTLSITLSKRAIDLVNRESGISGNPVSRIIEVAILKHL